MYKKDFDRLIQKSVPQNILLYGESTFYIDYYTSILTRKDPQATVHTFYFSDFCLESVVDILETGDLFSSSALVILKLDSVLSKKECDAIKKALKSNLNHRLITDFYMSDSKTPVQYLQECKKFASALKNEDFVEVRFFHPNFQDSLSLLRYRAKELGLEISDRALETLFHAQQQDIAIALNELEKYTLFNIPIESQEVQKFSYGLGSVGINDFIQELFDGNGFLFFYKKMQEEGLESMNLLRELERYFYILFLFCSYAKIYGRCEVQEILGYTPPQAVVETYVNRALKLKLSDFQGIFEILQEWRNGIFMGKKEIDLQALIKIKAIL